jgi:murein DD-endopeptidase MepM/ murein hydrolase activator NlpD
MKVKVFLAVLAALIILSAKSPAWALIEECYDEACEIPTASASQFFMDDVNDMEEIDDLAAIPIEGQFWPVAGIITGRFGKWRGGRHHGHYHVGVDIAAPYGTTIVSPLSGTVAFVGRKGGYGLTLIIDHGNGVSTLYGHNEEIMVSEGDKIEKGQPVSKIGLSGHSTGPHLHYEVRLDGHPVNPLAWTQKFQTQSS